MHRTSLISALSTAGFSPSALTRSLRMSFEGVAPPGLSGEALGEEALRELVHSLSAGRAGDWTDIVGDEGRGEWRELS